jgi:hypothetical protein
MYRRRCCRPEEASDSIEYLLCSGQISFLLLSSLNNRISTENCSCLQPTLITFPSDATLKMILSEKQFINLAVTQLIKSDNQQQQNTAYFQSEGKILDDNRQFSSVNPKENLILVINENIQLKFHESKSSSPSSTTLAKHCEGLCDRLPTENGHRPAPSKKEYTYPNKSLDLLFDTLHGQLSYLNQYLQSHFGDRHEFTVYPIQKQPSESKQWNEWETGMYRMRGDIDGTVHIALASDWYIKISLYCHSFEFFLL